MKRLYSKKNGVASLVGGVNVPVDAEDVTYGNSNAKVALDNRPVNDVIGTVESTNTATNTHAEGSYFINATGQLVKATAAIAIGDTISSSNTEATTISDVLKSANSSIGNMSALTTTDKTSLVGAVNEVAGDVSDLDTGKADKVSGATNGNLAGLNASGNLIDADWSADKTTTSRTGNPISITGLKSNQLAINPIITLEPIQAGSGDPSPSNVRAISGYDKIEVLSCGKNIFNGDIEQGTIVRGENVATSDTLRFKEQLLLKQSTYAINCSATTTVHVSAVLYNKDGTYNRDLDATWHTVPYSFTLDGTYNVRFVIHAESNITPSSISNLQLEESTSATTYVPYHKTTDLSLTLGQTIYGGTLDVEKGILTVDRGYVDLGSLDYTYLNVGQFYVSLDSIKIPDSDIITSGISSKFKSEKYDNWTAAYLANHNYFFAVGELNYVYFHTTDEDSSSASEFKSSVAGTQLVYPLATPYTIQLTPHEISLLKDYAYVSTNGTSISLSYHNGEIASLADVSQLSETVNELGDVVTEGKANIDCSLPIIQWSSETGSLNVEKMVRALCRYIADNKKIGIFTFEIYGMLDGIAISGYERTDSSTYDVIFNLAGNQFGVYSARFNQDKTYLKVWDASGNLKVEGF